MLLSPPLDVHAPRSALPAVVAIVGPTASGKTALSIRVAEYLKTEIISADSMQFYRHMQIGTGAPTPEELARVPHHFVAFLDPLEEFSAGTFEVAARKIVSRLNAEGKPAVVVGGSGLYVRALIDGLFPGPPRDEAIRARFRAEAESFGVPALYERLRQVDPVYADHINSNDLRRIIRALEVFQTTGVPLSELHRVHRESMQPLSATEIGLDMPREELYQRIHARVEHMLEQGLLEEVKFLIDHGYSEAIYQLRSLGYRELAAHLRGETSLDEAIELMKKNTRHFAKRQLTWFRADRRIHWIQTGSPTRLDEIAQNAIDLLH